MKDKDTIDKHYEKSLSVRYKSYFSAVNGVEIFPEDLDNEYTKFLIRELIKSNNKYFKLKRRLGL